MEMTFSSISNIVFSFAMFLIGLVIIMSIVGFGAWLYLSRKRYEYRIIILEKDGFGKPGLKFDKGGIFVDNRTKNKRFFLKKNNVGLNPDNIPSLHNEQGKKYVFMVQDGLKNFKYITYENVFDGELPSVGEEDVNWAINAYDSQKKIFGETMIQKLLPYIGLIILGVFIIGMVAMVMQKITVVSDAAVALKEAAQALAQAKSGTAIIQ